MDVYAGSDAPMAPERPHPSTEKASGARRLESPRFWKSAVALLAFIILASFISGCTSTKPTLDEVALKSTWCSTNEPRRYTPEQRAVLTPEQKDEALKHNRKGADWCGWKA